MMNNKGTTLVELLIVLILGGMVLLSVGSITDIGKQSYKDLTYKNSIHNSITYGFKLIQIKVREGGGISVETTSSPWIGNRLVVGQVAFGVYDETGTKKSFVYLSDKDDVNSRETIFEVLDTDTVTNTYSISGDMVTATINVVSGDVNLNVSTKVLKRT